MKEINNLSNYFKEYLKKWADWEENFLIMVNPNHCNIQTEGRGIENWDLNPVLELEVENSE